VTVQSLAYRDAKGRWCSEGRRRFGVVAAGQQGTVAAGLGISQPAVSQLVSGQTRPGLDVAARIEFVFGIACSEWVLAPERANISGACVRSPEGESTLLASR
jgi:DNA-binding transcriptional regulator YdaS (Cro superfamily)